MAAAAAASGRGGDAARALAATVLRVDGSKAAAVEDQPLLERRILFHPARKLSSISPSLPPGVEPLNNPAADLPSTQKRSWEAMATATGFKPREHEEDDIVLEWGAPVKIGAGLSNLGNTCFLNSVLQCLTYTPPLSKFLESGQHKATCRNSGFCALCALEGHVKNALRSWGKVVSPNILVKNLRCISRAFQPWRQEDAHEYLRYLLEALHKACLHNKTPGNAAEQEKSLMYKIFGGQLRSQVKCTNCMHCSDTVDPFLDLSLEITHADSLPKALARFTATEVLDGENKYQCGKCKMKVRALKRFTIESAPNILTVQFKRFSSFGHHGRKIDKKVHFGRTLDISPFMTNGKRGASYDLYGVLVHSGGSTHSGHYYCFVRTAADMWHVLDDTRVKQLSEQAVLDQRAYILFYMRKTDRKKQVSSALPSSVPSTSVAASQVVSPALIRTDVPSAAFSRPVEAVPLPKPLNADDDTSRSSQSADKVKEPADCVNVQGETQEAETNEEPPDGAKVQPANDVGEPDDQKVEPELEPKVEPAVETETKDVAEMEPSGGSPTLASVDVAGSASLHGSDASQESLDDIDNPAATGSAACEVNSTSEASSPSSNKRKVEGRLSDKPESRNGFKHKTDSPRKCDRKYMKLLRAMPRSRRLLFEKALELNQGDNAKRRKQNDESRRDAKMNGTRPSYSSSSNRSLNVLRTSESGRNGAKMNGDNPPSSISNGVGPAMDTNGVQAASRQRTGDATRKQGARNELFGAGVARWDGVEANGIDHFLRAEHKAPIARRDEWDEEYDRGKVKKVRRGAGGGRLTPCKDANPFQTLAGGKNQ